MIGFFSYYEKLKEIIISKHYFCKTCNSESKCPRDAIPGSTLCLLYPCGVPKEQLEKEHNQKIIKGIMESMGCEQVSESGLYNHPEIDFTINLSEVTADKILYSLKDIFFDKGWEASKKHTRKVLGFNK